MPDLLSRARIPPTSDRPSATLSAGSSFSSNYFDVSGSNFIETIFAPTYISTISKPELATERRTVPKLELVKGYLINGWPRTKPQTPQLRAYFDGQCELSTLHCLLYCELRAVVPIALRKRLLVHAHEAQYGVKKMKP